MKKYILAFAAILSVTAFAQTQQALTPSQQALRKLQMAEYAINYLYVDKVNESKLVEDAIVGMLKELDPHSVYSNAKETKAMNEPLQGGFEGIGVQFQMSEDTLLIIQPVSGGPSEKAGILAGDRIITVNDTAIAGVKMSTEEVMRRLKGPKGTKVNLGILRRGTAERLPFLITRDKIPVYSLNATYMAAPGVGYIKIDRFGATTYDEFMAALKKLRKAGMKDLILDLQGNGGGYLNAAIDIANEFLNAKDLIVYTEGRNSKRSDFFAKGDGTFRRGRLVVMVDEYSASASEIVTGAIQDQDRGVVVGRRSFGKGLVQRPIDLPDGSMIRLTVARYYTPAGRCIQKPYESNEEYNRDLINRYNNGEMMSADSIHFPDSLKCHTQHLKRVVYGGGGIMPDFFVPVDTTTLYHRQIAAKGLVIKVVNQYVEENRESLKKKFKGVSEYLNSFDGKEALLNHLRTLADEAKIPFNEVDYDKSKLFIGTQLQALVARDIWDMSEYYQVMNGIVPDYVQALQIIQSDRYDKILKSVILH